MLKLNELIKNCEVKTIYGDKNRRISSIQYDSRKCENGSMFVALRGNQVDGHNYINSAIQHGANVIVCEEFPVEFEKNSEVTFTIVENTRIALGKIANTWFNDPTKDMYVVGVTGTNGKTTITYLLKSLFEANGEKAGIIGTTGIIFGNENITATHTTPESLELLGYFAMMKKDGIKAVAIEVSSHALHQHRADNIRFNAGLFTNLTHDHLDYHQNMPDYAAAKKRLFELLPEDALAIVFDNSEYSRFMLEGIKCRNKFMIGRTDKTDIKIKDENFGIESTQFTLDFNKNRQHDSKGIFDYKTILLGKFNIDNAGISAALCQLKGMNPDIIKSALETATGAPGRMQRIKLKNGAVAIVDYAHTPDALEKALFACREVLNTLGSKQTRLICVFGCGGDRDTTKRPEMGKIASNHADIAIITSDNPRTEDPDKIIEQIFDGVDSINRKKTMMIPNRAEAIRYAVENSKENDIILVAGKGHENYQIIGTTKHHFDDTEELIKFS